MNPNVYVGRHSGLMNPGTVSGAVLRVKMRQGKVRIAGAHRGEICYRFNNPNIPRIAGNHEQENPAK